MRATRIPLTNNQATSDYDRSLYMKKQFLFFALALALPMSVFARSQGSSHQQTGATSHRTQQRSATSHSQFGQRQSTAQKGNASQLRGNGTGNAAMNGTQNVGSGKMSQGPQGNMSPNGNGNAMGGGPMGQGYQGNMGSNGNAAAGNMGQGNHGKMNPNGNDSTAVNGTSMGMGQGQTAAPQQP